MNKFIKLLFLLFSSVLFTGCWAVAELTPGLDDKQRRIIHHIGDDIRKGNEYAKRRAEHKEHMDELKILQNQVDSLTIEIKKCQNK